MHLLAAAPGAVDDGSAVVDLGQTPGDIVVLSAADTDLACLARAQRRRLRADPRAPSLRLASLLALGRNLSVDLYVESVIENARLVIVRLLGGKSYWRYGVEQVAAACRKRGIPVAFVPGDDQPDAELTALSTVAAQAWPRLWDALAQGGVDNAEQGLRFAADLIGHPTEWREPVPLAPAGLYPADIRDSWTDGAPLAVLAFYRALALAGNDAPVIALTEALRAEGFNPAPIFVASLKDPLAAGVLEAALADIRPDVILNATAFSVAAPGTQADTPFAASDCPVLQVVFSGESKRVWRDGARGLSARDIAMNVALPEVDGRVLTRAVSFKARAERDAATQADLAAYDPVPDRVRFVAETAARWARLRRAPARARRVALVLANYPNRDGRIGNGVGLDTPAATIEILKALRESGYDVGDFPKDGDALMRHLAQGPTNDFKALDKRRVREVLPRAAYDAFFASLPEAARRRISDRWGAPETDPFYLADRDAFALTLTRFGSVAVGVQPARGYNVDPAGTYHDPALAPPHAYLAFYAWLRTTFNAHAVVHMGKHGTLEWLPGKALALSESCFPEVVFGPTPHIYPFIVNDPGEGAQAKRRAGAVIIDHLTPPLTRAETYGPLKDLEALVDEYYEAAGVDPRRLKTLKEDILSLSRAIGLDDDLGLADADGDDASLAKLDNHLCELKELQIRDGLHVFGRSPRGGRRADLLAALARVPGVAAPSLPRAVASDFALGFDPLDCEMAAPWTGPRPAALSAEGPWRTVGDAVERLELFARRLIEGGETAPGPQTEAALKHVAERLAPAVDASGGGEIDGLLRALAGRFVAPGPSGAPTRGRPDVLPTGRNFYSVDTRVVPTPAAWTLGWKSAQMLVRRHAQEQGEWPTAVALSAWGTSNMRTGGDDIAQGLALMGARPTWDSASRRVSGFEILPAGLLDRPRVDVTLRVSGFFRDAFPNLIDLFDSAARAVAALDEPEETNPLAAKVRAEAARRAAKGEDAAAARRRAASRVFGSKPGAYGAGLQALIDERGWTGEADLARAYIAWGGYVYGDGQEGEAAHGLFETRLRAVKAVIHNQDNREHDVLDSDDYYQFEGGLAAAARSLSGNQPCVYHPDHSRPQTPRIRTLTEEIARVTRGRAANPKWIRGVMGHGYKGAFEMAATVDYLFAFAATARCVKDHQFDALFDAYLAAPDVRAFLKHANCAALKEMAARFCEAIDRGLWRPRRNSAPALLKEILEDDRDAAPARA